ncbi:MAG: outer membrane lipoprotein-sorting protein [Nitrospirae bacterium]|nr:outer membrane lipoprotein-sorting protein [Nitrospirota bacterium]
MSKRSLILLITGLLLILTSTLSYALDQNIVEIIRIVDRLHRSDTSNQEMEMTIVTPNWERSMTFEIWTEKMDKTFIYIKAPKKDLGTTTLRINREMWNFFPNINKVMKVPPSMMMGSWMGSDFTNDDLAKESSLESDYIGSFIVPEDKENYNIELIPKGTAAIVWGKITVKVRKSDMMPLEQVFYDEKGQKMRIMEFKDVKTFDGKLKPSILEMRPLNKNGYKTVIKIIDAKFDRKLEKDIFSLRNLQKTR